MKKLVLFILISLSVFLISGCASSYDWISADGKTPEEIVAEVDIESYEQALAEIYAPDFVSNMRIDPSRYFVSYPVKTDFFKDAENVSVRRLQEGDLKPDIYIPICYTNEEGSEAIIGAFCLDYYAIKHAYKDEKEPEIYYYFLNEKRRTALSVLEIVDIYTKNGMLTDSNYAVVCNIQNYPIGIWQEQLIVVEEEGEETKVIDCSGILDRWSREPTVYSVSDYYRLRNELYIPEEDRR